ncbi:hypothetical protein KJ885_04290 [Patescibacteria group bacterium]|nr:hypothetical protein [Patescibacteria group bacterium]
MLIHCMDFRLHEDIKNWMQNQGILGDTDLVSVAGAGKDIINPEWPLYREYVLRQVQLSIKLHDMKRVILMHHTDCGAYGGKSAFGGSPEKEEQKHIADMQGAAALLKQKWPDLQVSLVLAKMEGDKVVEFKEIG